MTYTYTKGTTAIEYFWGDMHTYSIRADKIINSYADLKEVVDRFEADKSQFDYTDYFVRSNFHKAVREYTVTVKRQVRFEVMVFEYQDKEYRIRTRKHTSIMKARKNADKIVSWKEIQLDCLLDDATGDVIGEGEIISEMDMLETYDLF